MATESPTKYWEVEVKARAQRFLCAGVFVLLEKLVRMSGIPALFGLPAPLIGLMLLFAALLALESAGAALPVYNALEPGYRFLVKWAPLFFIPALVKLPLVEERFSTSVYLRLCFLLTVGWVVQLVFAATVASLYPPLHQVSAPRSARSLSRMEEGLPEPYPRPGRPFRRRFLPAYAVVMTVCLAASRLNVVPGLAETTFMVCSMLFAFVAGQNAPAQFKAVVHPVLGCLLGSWVCAALWTAVGVPQATPQVRFNDVLSHYAGDWGAGSLVSMFLGPLVVALALLLYERRELLKKDLKPIMTTCVASAASGIFGTAIMARLLGLPTVLAVASIPRCVTAPLALGIAGMLDASAAFAIPMVVISGFLGAMCGSGVLNTLNFRTPRSRGLALGASSHGLGAASLGLTDPQAFPYGALGFVLAGGFSVILVALPPVRALLLAIVG